ncbi:putative deoxyribonuclease TATDN2 [Mizuhopecten yessoensis]|nr:putative deoxyribonuclease TATDN2 [Mizuhopecten yessoensis]
MTAGSEELVNFKMGGVPKESVELVDSHFHLDMWCRRSQEPRLGEEGPDSATQLVLVIANYCYPRNWPTGSARRDIRSDTRIRFSFGIHPRLAALESDQTLRKWGWELERLMDVQGTVSVGECGLDTSGRTSWRVLQRQKMIFESQVRIAARRGLPIVIHCRGGMRTSEECLPILGKHLMKTHRVHRHCFTGDLAEHRMWSEAFPNCKFGISPLIIRDRSLRSVVKQLSLEDLLIESDAPYFPLERGGVGSPFQVEGVVEAIAEDRAISIRSVAEATTRNARGLYQIE